jgi:hypothetical protein
MLVEAAFAYCSSLESISIPASIPKACFAACQMLSDVTFQPESRISGIGESAFAYCSSLESIRMASSVGEIGPVCFHSCPYLMSIVLEAGSKLSDETVWDLRSGCEVSFE